MVAIGVTMEVGDEVEVVAAETSDDGVMSVDVDVRAEGRGSGGFSAVVIDEALALSVMVVVSGVETFDLNAHGASAITNRRF